MTNEEQQHVFTGAFSTLEDVIQRFGLTPKQAEALRQAKRLYAVYDVQPYEGYAVVVWQIGDQWWEVHASHCSCHGLADQWEPEATLWPGLCQYMGRRSGWKKFQAKVDAAGGLGG